MSKKFVFEHVNNLLALAGGVAIGAIIDVLFL